MHDWDFWRRLFLFQRYVDSLDSPRELDYFQDIEVLFRNGRKYADAMVRSEWRKLLETGSNHGLLSLYMHIPFCISRCNYCCYDSKIPSSRKEIDDYMGYLVKRMHQFAPVFKDARFNTLYVGGGTPNVLSAEQLKDVFDKMNSCFFFIERAEKKIELNPWFHSDRKLDVLKAVGFNKVSFGVQSLDKDTLKSANRGYQDERKVIGAIKYANGLGFDEVNVDLMFGLESDDDSRFIGSFTKILELQPESINVYKLQPTEEYARMFVCNRSDSAFSRVYADVDKLLERMARLSKRYGYATKGLSLDPGNMAWGFRRTTSHDASSTYTFFHDRPISCLGLGLYSQSHIFSRLVYKELDDGYNGYPITMKREMVNHLINELNSNNHIDTQAFRDLFGKEVSSVYPIDRLMAMRRLDGMDGHLRYVPKTLKERMKWFMFFLEQDYLEMLLAERNIDPSSPPRMKIKSGDTVIEGVISEGNGGLFHNDVFMFDGVIRSGGKDIEKMNEVFNETVGDIDNEIDASVAFYYSLRRDIKAKVRLG